MAPALIAPEPSLIKVTLITRCCFIAHGRQALFGMAH
jgi:hypothetical protein